MDLDAEFNRLRKLTERVEPVIADFEGRQGDGMGTPKGYTAEHWAEMSKVYDRLGLLETRLTPWDQVEGEKDIPPGIQDLAQRILGRIDRIEDKLADVEKFAAELARLSRLTADLAEIVENKAPLEPLPRREVPGEPNGAVPSTAPSLK